MWLAAILILSLSIQLLYLLEHNHFYWDLAGTHQMKASKEASVALLDGKGRVHPRNTTPTTEANSIKRKDPKPTQPFDFPSQEEIEKLIREEGFFMAVLTKLIELFYGMLTAPFRWVFRVFELMVTILKLAAESFRQLKHPSGNRS